MQRLFGWDLPPGCTNRMIEDMYGGGEVCEVCGLDVDECECPECPVCHQVGNPSCITKHGLNGEDK